MSDTRESFGVDFQRHFRAEASFLARTLGDGNVAQFDEAIRDDSRMNPTQFRRLVAEVNDNLAQDAALFKSLPGLRLIDTDGRVGVAQGDQLVHSVTKAPLNHPELDAAVDKPLPRLGEILVKGGYCSQAQMDDALKTQRYEDANGMEHRLVGDILVEKNYCTREQVMHALGIQQELREAKLRAEADENNLAMPLHREEGYYQLVKRLNPEMPDHDAVEYARKLRRINGDRIYLKEGEQLDISSSQL